MATTIAEQTNSPRVQVPLHFVWLEITGKCQRECEHCYADSGPKGTHGSMTEADWRRVIDECAAEGVEMVQFIGGEPTLHPSLPQLIQHALSRGLKVEVFSNFERIKLDLWDILSQEGVSLATSYYSADNMEHDAIVKRRGSHVRTKNNIAEAMKRAIPLRVGLIGVREAQDIDGAKRELEELGVRETSIGIDYLRQVGRGIRNQVPSTDLLYGKCTNGVLAILPDGSVQPCVFTRWPEMTIGNVRTQSLRSVIEGKQLREVRAELDKAFAARSCESSAEVVASPTASCQPLCIPTCDPVRMCTPTLSPPQPCNPQCQPSCLPQCWPGCGPNCAPACSPSCPPQGNCVPKIGRPCFPK